MGAPRLAARLNPADGYCANERRKELRFNHNQNFLNRARRRRRLSPHLCQAEDENAAAFASDIRRCGLPFPYRSPRNGARGRCPKFHDGRKSPRAVHGCRARRSLFARENAQTSRAGLHPESWTVNQRLKRDAICIRQGIVSAGFMSASYREIGAAWDPARHRLSPVPSIAYWSHYGGSTWDADPQPTLARNCGPGRMAWASGVQLLYRPATIDIPNCHRRTR